MSIQSIKILEKDQANMQDISHQIMDLCKEQDLLLDEQYDELISGLPLIHDQYAHISKCRTRQVYRVMGKTAASKEIQLLKYMHINFSKLKKFYKKLYRNFDYKKLNDELTGYLRKKKNKVAIWSDVTNEDRVNGKQTQLKKSLYTLVRIDADTREEAKMVLKLIMELLFGKSIGLKNNAYISYMKNDPMYRANEDLLITLYRELLENMDGNERYSNYIGLITEQHSLSIFIPRNMADRLLEKYKYSIETKDREVTDEWTK